MENFLRAIVCFCCAAFGLASAVNAQSAIASGTITADADQLETLQGDGDKTFSDIFSGDAGVANAFDFDAAASGAGAFASIDDVEKGTGDKILIEGLASDPGAFIQFDN